MNSAFIITLTGPSACGKGLVTEEFIEYSKIIRERCIDFYPFMFQKDVTRSYRMEEALKLVKGNENAIDVNSVKTIPEEDDIVYRTYGDEYALNSCELSKALKNNRSPIVVINDIRVVEELKRLFKGQVLSLFIFRHIIPDIEHHQRAGANRGGTSSSKILSRYEKAVALYRVFIENIHIFDRVILNVGDKHLARIQTQKIVDGVFNNKIKLDKKITKGPKLFIVSGNAASGKDDIIKAAKYYGKQQADILVKSTTRQEEDGDVGEIICKYVPSRNMMESMQKQYNRDINWFNKFFTLEIYEAIHRHDLRNDHLDYLNKHNEEDITYDEYVLAKYNLAKMEEERKIPSAVKRFWSKLKEEQENRKVSLDSKKELPQTDYEWILENYFDLNESDAYIDIEELRANTISQQLIEEKKIEDSTENKSWLLIYKDKEYILYENNLLYGEPIKYGFEIGVYVNNWSCRTKHLVLTASLPNMFRICREKFGTDNVITAFTYSQISREEHEKNSDAATGTAKSKEYNDIVRYAYHIADFDYALIYAETSLTNLAGNQKDELIDQMFRLFRTYNK